MFLITYTYRFVFIRSFFYSSTGSSWIHPSLFLILLSTFLNFYQINSSFTFFTHRYQAESASFLPRQPSYWANEATGRPPFCILCLSLLSHSCLTNIEIWPSVPLHSLSQDFYLSGDLILLKSDWIGGYFWISPRSSRRPYSKCIELLRQVRYPLTFHSGSLYLFGRS